MSIATLEQGVVLINVHHKGDNLVTSDVRCSFVISMVKSIKTGPSFVDIMRLVTGLSEGKEKL